MTPYNFPESNVNFKAPPDLDESQCSDIRAYISQIVGGNLDGLNQIVVAWRPSAEELEQLKSGEAVYLTMIGGLAPHRLTTSFRSSIGL